MPGRRSFKELNHLYLDRYLDLRKLGKGSDEKKEFLRGWLSSTFAKPAITVEDLEEQLISFFSTDKFNDYHIVESLAVQSTVGVKIEPQEERSTKLRFKENDE